MKQMQIFQKYAPLGTHLIYMCVYNARRMTAVLRVYRHAPGISEQCKKGEDFFYVFISLSYHDFLLYYFHIPFATLPCFLNYFLSFSILLLLSGPAVSLSSLSFLLFLLSLSLSLSLKRLGSTSIGSLLLGHMSHRIVRTKRALGYRISDGRSERPPARSYRRSGKLRSRTKGGIQL